MRRKCTSPVRAYRYQRDGSCDALPPCGPRGRSTWRCYIGSCPLSQEYSLPQATSHIPLRPFWRLSMRDGARGLLTRESIHEVGDFALSSWCCVDTSGASSAYLEKCSTP